MTVFSNFACKMDYFATVAAESTTAVAAESTTAAAESTTAVAAESTTAAESTAASVDSGAFLQEANANAPATIDNANTFFIFFIY